MQHADDLFDKSWEVADVYHGNTLKDIFSEGVDLYIYNSLRKH